jgi:DNA-binding GntR family transcriptional regulator
MLRVPPAGLEPAAKCLEGAGPVSHHHSSDLHVNDAASARPRHFDADSTWLGSDVPTTHPPAARRRCGAAEHGELVVQLQSIGCGQVFEANHAEVSPTMAMTTERVASVLGQRIADGTYSPGELAPSASAVSTEFGVAIGTALRALALLDSRGLTAGGGQGRRRRVVDRHRAGSAMTAIERIRADIASGKLTPSSDLPSEAELVTLTGFSRYAVREALGELERTGEVLNRPGRRRQVAGTLEAPTTRYEEVASAIRDDLQEGRVPPGARLQSESELCKRFSVSRVTVRHALTTLEEAGFLARDAAGRRIASRVA